MPEPLIVTHDLHYAYGSDGAGPVPALRGVNLRVEYGEYLAIVGHNGSGKSTLAKCLNGLLLPTQGEVLVDGMSTRQSQSLHLVRACVAMVFQNPDNQFVATVVEDEVAFGPENLGVPRVELAERVERALGDAGLLDQRTRDPHTLSAGQKTRLAIAGVLAMRPKCLVLDESTAFLDPVSRAQILSLLGGLHAAGLTVVLITHNMDEVVEAQRVVVLADGCIAQQGTPRELFAQYERLAELGLGLPTVSAIARGLRERGLPVPADLLTTGELVEALVSQLADHP